MDETAIALARGIATAWLLDARATSLAETHALCAAHGVDADEWGWPVVDTARAILSKERRAAVALRSSQRTARIAQLMRGGLSYAEASRVVAEREARS